MTLTVDGVIEGYLKLRAKKQAIEAETKERLSVIEANMDKLEAWLKLKAEETGVTSFKTDNGTAFLTTVDFANVADWDAVLAHIKTNGAYDMLEKRVSKMAVRAYIEMHRAVPPGINYGTKLEVSVRKPAAS
jgi:hypothetical protein